MNKKLRHLFFTFIALFLCQAISFASTYNFEGVSPIFLYGEWDKIKYFTNLNQSPDNYTLELDKGNSGYIINTKRRIGLATGFVGRVTSNLDSIETSFGAGLAPVLKSYASFINKVDTLEEAEEKTQFIPMTEKQIDSYRIHDSAMFELVGGVVFHAGPTMGAANAGAKVITAAGWSCYVEKISNDLIFIELKKIKEIDTTAYANLTIPYVEAGFFNTHYRGFGYIIDYKSEAGMNAYKNFLMGRLDKIEEVTNQIELVKEIDAHKKSFTEGHGFGIPYIPFINYSVITEKSVNEESINYNYDGQTKNTYTLSLKRRDGTFFKLRKLVDTAFLISQSDSNTEMQLFFKDVTNYSKSEKISKIRDGLIELTDMKEFLDFKIKEDEKIGFAAVQFAVNFGEKIKSALNNNREKLIDYIENYKFEALNSKIISKKMIHVLKNKDANFKNLASFGQNFWSSKELFKLQLELVRKCGGDISYEVSGKRISRLLRHQTFKLSEECPL